MELKLEGKRALVSGSTAGIGWAIAAGLAAEGAEVVVNGRTQARVDAALAAIRDRHPRAMVRGFAADLGTAEGCARIAQAVPEVDVLVNNLGIFEVRSFQDIPDEEWKRFFEVNVLSGVRLSRTYLPGMLARNWGRILFISSESAAADPGGDDPLRDDQDRPARGGPRPGGERRRHRGHGELHPRRADPQRGRGAASWKAWPRSRGSPPSRPSGASSRPPGPPPCSGASPRIDEVAAFTVFVASGPASAVTGASLRVDGGVVRAIV